MHLFGLLFSSVLLLAVTANPLDYAGHGGFNCPDRKACTCAYILNDFEIECPVAAPTILVKIQPNNIVQLECFSMNASIYQTLPPMQIGDNPTVQFRRCPLPASGSSIQTILDRLGIRRVRSLVFMINNVDLGSSLVREHMQGLNDVERLSLSGSGLSDLPDNLFADLTNLTWLELRSQKVQHLPAKLFENLTKLVRLELGWNQLRSLEDGQFRHQRELKVLNLFANELKNLTKQSFNGSNSVVELDLSSNKLETLQPDIFATLPNLSNINLSGNHFRRLPRGLFAANRNLSEIRLLSNRVDLETLPAGFLANLTQLESVQITCGLSEVPADMLTGSINVKVLKMKSNRLRALPATLFADLSAALELDLSDNLLDELDDNLFHAARSLQVLRMSYNRLERISE